MALKLWAAGAGILGRNRGLLGGMDLLVMLVHFLQQTNPPVLPFLQPSEVGPPPLVV